MADFDDRKKTDQAENRIEEKPESDPVFVRERILNTTEIRKKWINRIVALIAGAFIFGVVSCLTFVWMRPYAERWMGGNQPETQIHIPKDEETTAEPETDFSETTASSEETTEAIEDVVESAVDSHQWSVSDYKGLYNALSREVDDVNKGIVTVTTRTRDMDWFDNPIETEGRASGAIWNITSSEMLILTGYQAAESEGTIEITFYNGTRVEASLKGADGRTGIAVISAALEDIDAVTRASVATVPLGNSFGVSAGQPVILAGSPKDYVGSVVYGMISHVRTSVQREDMDIRMMYTDVVTTGQATGFVVNLDGQIVGMLTSRTTGTNTAAIGISDLKAIIEKLSNGGSIAYFGIVGQDVTSEISERYRIPRGVYVSDSVLEGPAYNSGIQSGDVVVSMDGEEVLTAKSLQNFLEEREPGDVVAVRVMRADRSGYSEIEFSVTLGSR